MAVPNRRTLESYERRLIEYEARARPRERSAARTAGHRAPRARVRPAKAARYRVRRVVVLTALLLLLLSGMSLAGALFQRSAVGVGVRFVEWVRDNGGAGIVSKVESIWYSINAPSTGGPALRRLPKVGGGVVAAATTYVPPSIQPVITPALPGEGVWHGTGPLVRGAPPMRVTTFRPDPNYPQMVAGVAWIDSSRAWLQLYPGLYEPPNSGNTPAVVPQALRGELLATFNSGFKLEDDNGGFVAGGHLYAPLHDGMATLLRYRNGQPDVVDWTGGPDPGPQIEFARQNLPLIISNGQLNPAINDGTQWGATLGNAVRVWRSGVGIDTRGNLIYAAADNQTAASLAQILQHAGAVRAMELDINAEWVTFNFFGALGANQPTKLLPDMTRDATRYLTPDDRDFLAVFVRNG
jgi:hypothetical protein